jgi:hypothetical protein
MSENRKILVARNDAKTTNLRIDRWELHVLELDPAAAVYFSIHR